MTFGGSFFTEEWLVSKKMEAVSLLFVRTAS